tara:strand:- start:8286 stop:9107 length:822 start_codon:yes stop_codon:yes gene_type:complete
MTQHITDLMTVEERDLTEAFVRDGYVILDVEDRDALARLRTRLVTLAAEATGWGAVEDEDAFLNGFHDAVDVQDLNRLRLAVLAGLNETPDARMDYFRLAHRGLETLVGNELCMQRRLNLSIQLPRDESSLLPVHADVLSGDSPFEVVQWTPFVDVYGTKSMFFLSPDRNREISARLSELADSNELFEEIRPDLAWLEIRFGQTLIFNQNIFHGNVVNEEGETRWSLNCRYKAVFTPYADKRLGEFFEPITLRAASRIGLEYQLPTGFTDDDA